MSPAPVSVFRNGKSWLIACLVLGALVLSWGPESVIWAGDFDAQTQDIWLDPSIVYEDDTADVKAKFKNLSSSSGPYDGEATFDVAIIVYPPSGSGTRYFVNNTAFSYNQEKTYTMRNFTFNRTGTYTVHAEIYDINGEESGWDAAHRFDRLSETFTIYSPPELVASPSSHDFGTVTRGSTPEASFRVTNSGTGTLQWGVDSWPDWVDILEPLYSGVTGDGTVRIRVRSDAALGRHAGRIRFNSNGGDDPITLSANIVVPPPPDLDASPSGHDFGTVTRGSTPEASFRVTNSGTGTLQWGVDSWPDWVDILEPLVSGVTGDGAVRIRVRSDAALGRHAGRIRFNSNGGDDPITLSANIVVPPKFKNLSSSSGPYDGGHIRCCLFIPRQDLEPILRQQHRLFLQPGKDLTMRNFTSTYTVHAEIGGTTVFPKHSRASESPMSTPGRTGWTYKRREQTAPSVPRPELDSGYMAGSIVYEDDTADVTR